RELLAPPRFLGEPPLDLGALFRQKVRPAFSVSPVLARGVRAADPEARDDESFRGIGQARRSSHPGEAGRVEESVEAPRLAAALVALGGEAVWPPAGASAALRASPARDRPRRQHPEGLAGPSGGCRIGLAGLDAVLLVRPPDDGEEIAEAGAHLV